MSHLSTIQLAEMAQISKRQVQRLLDQGVTGLDATRTAGGHWQVADTAAARKWAKNHVRWNKGRGANLRASDKSGGIVTIEGISQSFDLWHRKMAPMMGGWNQKQIQAAAKLLERQAKLHAALVAMQR